MTGVGARAGEFAADSTGGVRRTPPPDQKTIAVSLVRERKSLSEGCLSTRPDART